jgi:hypothetical protein
MKRHRSIQPTPYLPLSNNQHAEFNLNWDNKSAFTCVEILSDEHEIGLGTDVENRHVGDTSSPARRTVLSRFLLSFKSTSKLQRMSSIASWLCLIDCTLLPAVTMVVPILGLANQGCDRLDFLHHVCHFATLYCLLPIGCLSTITNYLMHRQRWITLLATLGLLLVAMSNSYSGGTHLAMFHIFHQGFYHRMINLLGCSCLLMSNYWSHQVIRRNTPVEADVACCILHEKYHRPQHKLPPAEQQQRIKRGGVSREMTTIVI